jgi:hypothetical protein
VIDICLKENSEGVTTMLRKVIVLLIIMVMLAACGDTSDGGDVDSLLVTDGSDEQRYSVEDLKNLTSAQAAFEGTTFIGVRLSTLLSDAGYDPAQISAVKTVANDGFTANYGQDLFNKSDTLVAYARADGALSEDDGIFRMVLPDQEGKLNPRHLVEIKVIP